MKIALGYSAKFISKFNDINNRLTIAGHTVNILNICNSSDEEQKEILEKSNKQKIDDSDALYVVNGGSIDRFTLGHILYADNAGKKILSAYPLSRHIQEMETYKSVEIKNNPVRVCSFDGCSDPIKTGPCALCYE